jgi:hypothetical protein
LTSVMVAKECLAPRRRGRQPIAAMETPGRLVLLARPREQYAQVKRRRCLIVLVPILRIQVRPAVGRGSHHREQQRQRRLRDRPVRTRGLRTAPEPRSDGSRQKWAAAGMPGHSRNG